MYDPPFFVFSFPALGPGGGAVVGDGIVVFDPGLGEGLFDELGGGGVIAKDVELGADVEADRDLGVAGEVGEGGGEDHG